MASLCFRKATTLQNREQGNPTPPQVTVLGARKGQRCKTGMEVGAGWSDAWDKPQEHPQETSVRGRQ